MQNGERAATMRDVARQAGVGLATVSRVINGKPGVAPELVRRVTETARALGYRHDLTASSLRRADRRTATIALVLEDVANPFSSVLHRAVEDAAREEGILVLAGSSDEHPDRERELIDAFTLRRVEGLIVLPTGGTDEQLAAVRGHGTPIVCADRLVEIDRVDTVTVDNRDGTWSAVRRLRAFGHRRIAFLGDSDSIWTARQRYAGFADAHAEAGEQLDERLVRRGLRSEEAARAATIGLLTGGEPPSAVFAAQNLLTMGARRALQDLGAQEEVALIGFDDFPVADLLTPGVSVVAQDPASVGRTAARLLLARIRGGDDHLPSRHVVVPTRYVPRGSGEIRPRI
ncbi:LacI family DNA-binding transcriptional regulator [Actinoallomurus iriomotensis]|uniref:LacI family transcriptional regulator n=1 Tax=Actinoallomurus iriomotensis TaxID=478107 RepID=A0A9W6RVI5_9ACTN|nr:LacI family DNA-binding transcriptional regulator [Actinoallomurus iriomotensis]GLY82473.1 LacI family transcriptional regulator [Actinoallomurus iriomotensis]